VPNLKTPLHLDMLQKAKKRLSLFPRIKKAIKVLLGREDFYGLEWGDPENVEPLKYVKDHFLLPYINSDSTIIEIGPGGGRWTRYMLHAKQIFAIDFYQPVLDELAKNYNLPNINIIKNNGMDFPNIDNESIDLIFSFGTFVHLDTEIINEYLKNIKPLLKQNSNVIIQYSDKTKPIGYDRIVNSRNNRGFSDNEPEKMRKLILQHGYNIYEEDEKTMWHSSIIRFGL
tara:strand:+ start:264 stop:947 length:684 start_codon:yes stop_codon:yes gene_type:complete